MGGAGRLTDTGGLMYYGARYYLPELRRFISADTIVPGGANPLAYNRYAYVYNSPGKYTDPTGHVPFCIDSCDTHEDLSGGSTEDIVREAGIEGSESTLEGLFDLDDETLEIVIEQAELYGLPPEFIAAVIVAEVRYDTDWINGLYDYFTAAETALRNQECWYTSTCFMQQQTAGLALAAAHGYIFGELVNWGSLGLGHGAAPGIGNVHAGTAREADAYFESLGLNNLVNIPSNGSIENSADRMEMLLSNEGNVAYTAAVLRMYADEHLGGGDHSDLTVDQMSNVFVRFHCDPNACFESERDFRSGQDNVAGQRFEYELVPLLYEYQLRIGQ